MAVPRGTRTLPEAVTTLLKLLDNVVGRPGDLKTRSIRISNATFQSKVGRFSGAVQVLTAAGFEEVPVAGIPHLQLSSLVEDTSRLLQYVAAPLALLPVVATRADGGLRSCGRVAVQRGVLCVAECARLCASPPAHWA